MSPLIPESPLWGPDRSEEFERETKLKTALGQFLLGAVDDTCKPYEYEIEHAQVPEQNQASEDEETG